MNKPERPDDAAFEMLKTGTELDADYAQQLLDWIEWLEYRSGALALLIAAFKTIEKIEGEDK